MYRLTSKKHKIIYQTDTNIVYRYYEDQGKDTAIKFIEKIKWKQSIPNQLFIQKVDTIFRDKVKQYDLILHLEKDGDILRITAFNGDSLLKEYTYSGIYHDFIITPQKDNIFIKAEKFRFKPLNIGYELETFLNEKTNHSIKFFISLQYKKFFLEPYLKYNTEKNVKTGLELKYQF